MKLFWYAFVGLFAVLGLSLGLLNGAGVIFGLGFVGLAVMLQMMFMMVSEIRASRLIAQQHLEQQKRVADNLEWVMFAPDEQVRQSDSSARAVKQ